MSDRLLYRTPRHFHDTCDQLVDIRCNQCRNGAAERPTDSTGNIVDASEDGSRKRMQRGSACSTFDPEIGILRMRTTSRLQSQSIGNICHEACCSCLSCLQIGLCLVLITQNVLQIR